jgi:O-antigen ligase
MVRPLPTKLLKNPWVYVCALLAGTAFAVAFAPFTATLLIAGVSLASFLIWRFGALRGAWYLVLLTLPLKEPLSFDIQGTVSVYPVDVLVAILFAVVVSREGLMSLLRRSPSFRILAAILLLSLVGLYSASNVFWGIASIYRLAVQLAVFVVAMSLVRSTDEARRTLVAVAASLVVPAAYGLYQATLPYGAPVPDWGYLTTAYDLRGEPFLRVFSTMDHPLNFSHYVTTVFGLSVGLAAATARRGARSFLLCVAGLGLSANIFTYSAGGLLGMAVAGGVVIVARHSRKLMVAALVLVIVFALLAPPALIAKFERLLTGDAVTAAARIVTYEQSFMVLRDHPILGVGWGSIKSALKGEYRITRADPVAYGAENYFLQRAIALGLVGLGLEIALLVLYFRNLRRMATLIRGDVAIDALRLGMLTAGIAFLVQGQLIPAVNVSTNSVLWLLFAVAESLRAGPPRPAEVGVPPAVGGWEPHA